MKTKKQKTKKQKTKKPLGYAINFQWAASSETQARLVDENEALRAIAAELQQQLLTARIELRVLRAEQLRSKKQTPPVAVAKWEQVS